ncbi:MAG: bacteriophage holin [Alphaproteobacteria bacterium]|nr:bacteriophage holin [Alphaproteobacteria bacterium]
MAEHQHHATLGVISLGLAIGVTWGLFVFLLGIMATFFGWGAPLALILSSVYVGFTPTVAGTVAGAVWGFAEGFIAGCMIAWLYNLFLGMRRAAPKPDA